MWSLTIKQERYIKFRSSADLLALILCIQIPVRLCGKEPEERRSQRIYQEITPSTESSDAFMARMRTFRRKGNPQTTIVISKIINLLVK